MHLVLNTARDDHARVVHTVLSRAAEVLISIAYFKSAGLYVVKPELAKAVARGARIRLFCGLDFWLTDPAALLATLDLFERATDAKLYVCRLPTNFHPKLYCSIDGPNMRVLIGSANLSRGGLKNNIEASAVEVTSAESPLAIGVRRYFDRLEKTAGVELATRPLIRIYERECAIHRRHVHQAEQEAKREIAELDALQPAQLKFWLAQYLKDEKEQTELGQRVTDYALAKRILNRMMRERIESEQAFAALYERLVGGMGHKPLWASGGLYRARGSVVKHFPAVRAMLRAIRSRLHGSPEVAFDIGISHARTIEGLGPNVVTEAMTTWNPGKYPVLNRNPVTSLAKLGFPAFPGPAYFHGATYGAYARLLLDLKRSCGFDSFVQVNHFLNYVYWKTKKSARL